MTETEKLIEDMTKVRPEKLNEEGLKLFNRIMALIDERNRLIEKNNELQNMLIGKSIQELGLSDLYMKGE